jgi:RHS repeat-associated protein
MGGLMDYRARMYSPHLGRFISADSLIPDPANPQAWNRFSYVTNHPVNFNDPTGHYECNDPYGCDGPNDDNAESGIVVRGGGGARRGGGGSGGSGDQEGGGMESGESEPQCMVQIGYDGYWANICEGENGSEIHRFEIENPGIVAADLYKFDSPILRGVDVSLLILMWVVGLRVPGVRLPWKVATLALGSLMLDLSSTAAYTLFTPYDDALADKISRASASSSKVNVTVITDVYKRCSDNTFCLRYAAESVKKEGFIASDHFVVLVQPQGVNSYDPLYLNNIFTHEVLNLLESTK